MSDALTSKRRWQIRRIFLLRRESYTVAEAVRLLSIPRKELARQIARREIDAEGDRLTWQTVVSLAMDQWGVDGIEDALGSDAPRFLPPLLRIEPITVNLPAYLIRYLHLLAEENGASIDQQIARDLHDGLDVRELERFDSLIGGFREAVMFPES